MSSPPKEKAETRAGHPPAVKAGGMRIVQKHPHNSDAKEEKIRMTKTGKPAAHLNQRCSSLVSLLGVIRTSSSCSSGGSSETTSFCGKASSPTTCQTAHPPASQVSSPSKSQPNGRQ